MITLDYQTNNPRWGWSGVCYSSWEDYAFALGFLSNIRHYNNKFTGGTALIDVHFEGNDLQGAWGKEGRIHYYGNQSFIQRYFPDWYNNKSAGVGRITYRINSNDYIYSLIYDYDFKVVKYNGYTTRDIFPPDDIDAVVDILVRHLPPNINVDSILDAFNDGFKL